MGIAERKAALGFDAAAVLVPSAVERQRVEVLPTVEAAPIVAARAEVPGESVGSEPRQADAAEQGVLFEFQSLNPYEGKPLASRG